MQTLTKYTHTFRLGRPFLQVPASICTKIWTKEEDEESQRKRRQQKTGANGARSKKKKKKMNIRKRIAMERKEKEEAEITSSFFVLFCWVFLFFFVVYFLEKWPERTRDPWDRQWIRRRSMNPEREKQPERRQKKLR